MADNPFLSIVSTAEAFELTTPTREESLSYQAKLLGLWEQQQRVLGYTEASIANNSRNLDTFLTLSGKFIWEVTTYDVDRFYEQLVGRGLAYSTRRKYQSVITTFLDSLRSRHAHDIWQRYRVAVPAVLDKFNRHTHRQDDREDAVVPPARRRPRTVLGRAQRRVSHRQKVCASGTRLHVVSAPGPGWPENQ